MRHNVDWMHISAGNRRYRQRDYINAIAILRMNPPHWSAVVIADTNFMRELRSQSPCTIPKPYKPIRLSEGL
jgi:hypothetical protein